MKKLALFTGALLALAVALSSCGGEKKQDKVLRSQSNLFLTCLKTFLLNQCLYVS